jgi:hypothetical protein
VSASDDNLGPVTLTSTSLAPDASTSGELKYTVQESDLPGPLANSVTATGTPPAGEDVSDSASASVEVTDDDTTNDPNDPNDPTLPAAPEFTSPATSDSPTPTISGTAEPNSTLRLTITLGLDSSIVYTTTVDADGAWSIDLGTTEPISGTFSGLEDGQYQITATATDAAGNTSAPATQTLTVDIPKPGDPAAPVVTSSTETNDPYPTISGTAEAGVTITLTIDLGGGASVTYETTADGDGNWSIDLASDTPTGGALPEGGLSDGSYPVTVTATNETGSASTQYTLTVQTSTPAAGTTLYLPLIAR